jgi:hypothetical protein
VLVSYVAVAILACFGIAATRWSDWRLHVPGLLAIAVVCGIHTVVFGHSRYHVPLMPFVIIYAVAAVSQRSWRRQPDGVIWRSAAIMAVVVLLVIWGSEILVRDADRVRRLLA